MKTYRVWEVRTKKILTIRTLGLATLRKHFELSNKEFRVFCLEPKKVCKSVPCWVLID